MTDPTKEEIANEILGSESFMWLMAGSNHVESHLEAIRPAYAAWKAAGGLYWGCGDWSKFAAWLKANKK
jgi:hypothetical protein